MVHFKMGNLGLRSGRGAVGDGAAGHQVVDGCPQQTGRRHVTLNGDRRRVDLHNLGHDFTDEAVHTSTESLGKLGQLELLAKNSLLFSLKT
jgi:hypothetical protein